MKTKVPPRTFCGQLEKYEYELYTGYTDVFTVSCLYRKTPLFIEDAY